MHLDIQKGEVYFTADTHYSHRNMVRALSSWTDKESVTRNFKTIPEMNDTIISAFNERVKPNDTLIHLGDVAFITPAIKEFFHRLNCKNIYLVPGNHDRDLVKSKELQGYLRKMLLPLQNLTIYNQHMVVSHFAMKIWDRSHFGSWNLYGHSHNFLPDPKDYKQMDVGVDTNNYYPYHFEEIKEIMSKKTYRGVDGLDHY
jgi:calcineurin-like phosphoesterase family protein